MDTLLQPQSYASIRLSGRMDGTCDVRIEIDGLVYANVHAKTVGRGLIAAGFEMVELDYADFLQALLNPKT